MSSPEHSHLRWRYTEFDDRTFEIRGRTLFFIIVLFSFVLIVTLLFLYARWVCRYHRHVPSTSVSASPTPPPPPPQGLDPAIINSLPIVLHQPSPSPDGASIDDCCICLGLFQEGDKVKILPQCHHYYHSDCVDRWLTTHTSCPLCRASVQVSLP